MDWLPHLNCLLTETKTETVEELSQSSSINGRRNQSTFWHGDPYSELGKSRAFIDVNAELWGRSLVCEKGLYGGSSDVTQCRSLAKKNDWTAKIKMEQLICQYFMQFWSRFTGWTWRFLRWYKRGSPGCFLEWTISRIWTILDCFLRNNEDYVATG